MLESIHYGKEFEVSTVFENLGTNEVKWTLEKLGESVNYNGELTNDGGKYQYQVLVNLFSQPQS